MKVDKFTKMKELIVASRVNLKILSTDTDDRFDQAVEILQLEVPNVDYRRIDADYIENYPEKDKQTLLDLYISIRGEKEDHEVLKEKLKDPNIFANLMVKKGWADGIVSGATHPTADILRPAFQIIKTTHKDMPISSFMWLNKENEDDLFFADISVIPTPDPKQLSQIAIQTAQSVEAIFDVKPVVAMLAFSTNDQGSRAQEVINIREATKMVEESGIEVYGEIQWDAATRREVFELKMKRKSPKVMPNVFIFPNLTSGNIGYKIAATLGGYEAVGPVLQNIAAPVNDLSRGCLPQEIVNLVVLTCMQALNIKFGK